MKDSTVNIELVSSFENSIKIFFYATKRLYFKEYISIIIAYNDKV